jgi:hypothetical protein
LYLGIRIGCLKLPLATVAATEHIASGQEVTLSWPTSVSARPAPDSPVGTFMYWAVLADADVPLLVQAVVLRRRVRQQVRGHPGWL